ncbi:MAG: oxygen-independent coproporphyrinogen III oxidase [Firmicutes bacterium]|jgi:oxygen-independent coproporphyrinogen-3 oxidase|nr:oxygen-independent coproporphyrinogen III oxidase [Bacillota bacterium]
MLGVYVHIPFCANKCGYCDFHSIVAGSSVVDDYLEALSGEISHWADKLSGKPCSTLYIGGGTPTILSSKQLQRLLSGLTAAFSFESDFEFTVEANPGTLTPAKLEVMAEAGVNRISLGAQTFDDKLLKEIGRTHTVEDIYRSVELIRDYGISNINLDLIEGLPGQTFEQWETALKAAVALRPTHLSCYSLILEEGTPFYREFEQGTLLLPSDDEAANMFEFTQTYLPQVGFRHYEISNYAQPGKEAQHNLIYWHNQYYLGLGSGAHGYYNKERISNISDVAAYTRNWLAGVSATAACVPIDLDAAMDETMMLGLRLIDGVNEKQFFDRFNVSIQDVYPQAIAELMERGLLERQNGFLRLTKRGISLGNLVFSAFIR